jgi:hypothetical protein
LLMAASSSYPAPIFRSGEERRHSNLNSLQDMPDGACRAELASDWPSLQPLQRRLSLLKIPSEPEFERLLELLLN